MSEATEKLIDITEDPENPIPSDAPIPSPESLPTVKPEDHPKPWGGHIKYLWVSFFAALFTAMLSTSMGYISYVMSDGNEWVRYAVWTLMLLHGSRTIFRSIRPKKSKGSSDASNRVQRHQTRISVFSFYIMFSDVLARFCTNLGLDYFELDRVGSTKDICANRSDPLSLRRCHMWLGTRILQLIVSLSALVALMVLRRAAIKRFGKETIPMEPAIKVAAWEMGTLEQLNGDTEPAQA